MLSKYKVGLCNIFLQHTSASLTINEVSCNGTPVMHILMRGFMQIECIADVTSDSGKLVVTGW